MVVFSKMGKFIKIIFENEDIHLIAINKIVSVYYSTIFNNTTIYTVIENNPSNSDDIYAVKIKGNCYKEIEEILKLKK